MKELYFDDLNPYGRERFMTKPISKERYNWKAEALPLMRLIKEYARLTDSVKVFAMRLTKLGEVIMRLDMSADEYEYAFMLGDLEDELDAITDAVYNRMQSSTAPRTERLSDLVGEIDFELDELKEKVGQYNVLF
ncbi:MAG: hypothetical protein J6R44_03695 [Clostridia bacterium]|nr:hypothetical protein [Clostridia bacterium]